jgi:biotin transport system substrate-specific component
MAKSSGGGSSNGGLRLLAGAGGIALLLLAARVSIPMVPEPTTLLSLAAVLLGSLVGAREGFVIGLLYAAAVIVGLPSFVADGHLALENPLAMKTAGLLIGVSAAAFTAGHFAPHGQGSAGRVLLAMLAGHAAYLALGTLWLMRFETWQHALYAGIVPHLLGAAAKSAAALVAVLVLRKFI